MSHPLRTVIGSAALAAGMWAITATARADAPDLPKESYKKAADADLKFLQDRVADLVKKGTAAKDGFVKPAVGVALLLAAYGDALGDAALKGDALKVAEALAKKDFKAADDLAKGLAVKPGAAGKPGALPKPSFKDDVLLDAVMNPFRGTAGGGLNIDKDLKDLTKNTSPAKIDPAAVEILGVRSAVLNGYGLHAPNDKAKVNDAGKKQWEDWSNKSIDLSKQIAAEAGKGKGADEKKLKTLLTNLSARCADCHNKFRDD